MEILPVFVVATTPEGTRYALDQACRLAHEQHVPVTLVVPRIIPYSEPLEPDHGWTHEVSPEYDALARECGADARVKVCRCRQPEHMLAMMLIEHARVVVGGRHGHWRLTAEERLARALQGDGHEVIFADTGARTH